MIVGEGSTAGVVGRKYAGVLSSAASWRPLVVPPPGSPERSGPAKLSPESDEPRARGGKRSRYWHWAELLHRTFGSNPTCDRCGGPVKVVALVTEHDSIVRYLRHLGEPTEPEPLAPARGPPYYQSRVLRRRPPVGSQEQPRQQDMFVQ